MKYLVTGGAGYIGSHVVDMLLSRGHKVIAVDNLSTGNVMFLHDAAIAARKNKNFTFIESDLLNCDYSFLKGVDAVYHFAANADIRKGFANTNLDFSKNTEATLILLQRMQYYGVKRIVFASTSAVLGEVPRNELPASENVLMREQTSLYGASKLAAEGIISSFCEGFDFEAYVFRFTTVLGPRYPHGFVFDFVKKLLIDPEKLEVLGDGTGIKSSIHVRDVVSSLALICEDIRPAKDKIRKYEVFHIGNDHTYTVSEAAQWVANEMNLKPKIIFGDSVKGWPGDIPHIHLDTTKIKTYGWSVNYTPKESVSETVTWLLNNRWILMR